MATKTKKAPAKKTAPKEVKISQVKLHLPTPVANKVFKGVENRRAHLRDIVLNQALKAGLITDADVKKCAI